jgi:hypothetical protein
MNILQQLEHSTTPPPRSLVGSPALKTAREPQRNSRSTAYFNGEHKVDARHQLFAIDCQTLLAAAEVVAAAASLQEPAAAHIEVDVL